MAVTHFCESDRENRETKNEAPESSNNEDVEIRDIENNVDPAIEEVNERQPQEMRSEMFQVALQAFNHDPSRIA